MIKYENSYRQWVIENGVGSNDFVASSVDSYISYLNTVSKLIGEDISPSNCFNEDCVLKIALRLKGLRSDKSISNYKSALRQYAYFAQNRS
jgi:hypothetical protein